MPDITSIKLDATTGCTVSYDLTPAGGSYRVVLAYVPNVSAGAHTPIVTAIGNMLNAVMIASEFSGVAASSAINGAGASANGYGTTPKSGALTTMNGSDLWVAVFTGATTMRSVPAGSGRALPANGYYTGTGSTYPECEIDYEFASSQTSGSGSFTITSLPNLSAAAVAFRP